MGYYLHPVQLPSEKSMVGIDPIATSGLPIKACLL
jgi:hypothetical protein